MKGKNEIVITCKGSITLGTACLTCEKCKKEMERILNKERENMKDRLDHAKQKLQESLAPIGIQGQGWICPRCGRGNAPFNSTCPYMPMPVPEIT